MEEIFIKLKQILKIKKITISDFCKNILKTSKRTIYRLFAKKKRIDLNECELDLLETIELWMGQQDDSNFNQSLNNIGLTFLSPKVFSPVQKSSCLDQGNILFTNCDMENTEKEKNLTFSSSPLKRKYNRSIKQQNFIQVKKKVSISNLEDRASLTNEVKIKDKMNEFLICLKKESIKIKEFTTLFLSGDKRVVNQIKKKESLNDLTKNQIKNYNIICQWLSDFKNSSNKLASNLMQTEINFTNSNETIRFKKYKIKSKSKTPHTLNVYLKENKKRKFDSCKSYQTIKYLCTNKYNLINSKKNKKSYSKKVSWPIPVSLQAQFKNFRRYYKETDHKYLHRVVCCVCGTFYITKNTKQFVTSISLLYENKNILSCDNLFDLKSKVAFNFLNKPELNDFVLDSDGFIGREDKVNICVIL